MCKCGCNTCETKIRGPLLTESKVKPLLSEGLNYHINKKIPLFETVYRIGSNKHLSLIKEARKMYSRGIIDLCEEDEDLIKTNIGEFAIYEGEVVPLDLPMINEKGAATTWEDGEGNKVTLQDILDMTKNIPQKDYPTKKLTKLVLNWDDNPEELKRIEQVEISKQYPILIMVDEAGKIQWILDGNHRAQKALRAKTETIPAKLIKPSMLDAKAKKVLLGVVDEGVLDEAELTPKEQKIVDDILKELSESDVNTYLSKIKNYAKKGLLTLAMISSIASGLQAQGIPQNDIDTITQNSIELIQQKDIVDSESESLLKDSLSKKQYKELKKEAKEMGAYITAVRGTNRNALASQANMQAKVYNKQGTIKVEDTKTFSIDGKYLYIMFYKVNSLNEAEFKGKDVKLNKPKRGGSKAYYVYVNSGKKTKDGKVKAKKVSFGSGGLRAKIKNKDARQAFAKRHRCSEKKDRTKASYWSCNLPRYASALGLGSNMNTFW